MPAAGRLARSMVSVNVIVRDPSPAVPASRLSLITENDGDELFVLGFLGTLSVRQGSNLTRNAQSRRRAAGYGARCDTRRRSGPGPEEDPVDVLGLGATEEELGHG
jgi:hypothetical protein